MSEIPADLPQVWQKPAFAELLDALKSLRVEPPVWNMKVSQDDIQRERDSTAQHRREVARYLSSIIKSNLPWIKDEEQREELWTEASRRLAERCGRAAMGELTRRWPFESDAFPWFELTVKEPALTGDSLGLKTWGSSYVLAQMLPKFSRESLSHLFPSPRHAPSPVLELGSGTGLLGLAAAAMWKTRVVLSDLPVIMPNLKFNLEKNRPVVESLGGSVDAGALTWGGEGKEEVDPKLFGEKHQFKIILIADPMYDDVHPRLLASAVDDHLAMDTDARAVIMVPLRDMATLKLLNAFRDELLSKDTQITCLDFTIEDCTDDWDKEDSVYHFDCWLGVWARQKVMSS